MSRGNLGLDVLPEKMALVQKAVTNACNLVGKPILITRFVDTMVNAPRPTRCVQGFRAQDALTPGRPCLWLCHMPHPLPYLSTEPVLVRQPVWSAVAPGWISLPYAMS